MFGNHSSSEVFLQIRPPIRTRRPLHIWFCSKVATATSRTVQGGVRRDDESGPSLDGLGPWTVAYTSVNVLTLGCN